MVSLSSTLMHLPHVPRHILFAFEGLPTHAAKKEPLVAVHMSLMNLQVAAVGEGLLTDTAAVNRVSLEPMADLNVLQVAFLIAK